MDGTSAIVLATGSPVRKVGSGCGDVTIVLDERDVASPAKVTGEASDDATAPRDAEVEASIEADNPVEAPSVAEASSAPSVEAGASSSSQEEEGQDNASTASQTVGNEAVESGTDASSSAAATAAKPNASEKEDLADAAAGTSPAPSPAPCSSANTKMGAQEKLGVYREALKQMNKQLGSVDFIDAVSKRTRISPLIVVSAAVCCCACFCLFGLGSKIIFTFLGIIYPAFESFKCLEALSDVGDSSKCCSEAEAMKFWLIYWVVVATFSTVESVFYYVLIWLPFYHLLKLIVLVWLYLPQTRGANHMYHWLVAPMLRRNRHQIDNVVDKSTSMLTSAAMSAVASSVKGGAGGIMSVARLLGLHR